MYWHRLLPFDDKSLLQAVNNLMQVDCQDFLSTRLMKVVSANCSQWRCQVSEFGGGGGGHLRSNTYFFGGEQDRFHEISPPPLPKFSIEYCFCLI